MYVSSNFSGGALSFSVTGDGVTIDPETGILSITTDALRDGVSVTVTATNSGGEVAKTFRLDVAIPEIAASGGCLKWLRPPVPAGNRRDRQRDLGRRRDLERHARAELRPISGCSTVSRLRGPWRCPTCRAPATMAGCCLPGDRTQSAGTAEAVNPRPRCVMRPLWRWARWPICCSMWGPVQFTVAAGAEFSGENLVFSVTGAGAEIDNATGVVTISTDDLYGNETVTVTAANSGGDASVTFMLTVLPVAPVLKKAPSLNGTGVIGLPVTVEPGIWSGMPAPELSFRWICGGEVVTGATDASYVPGAAEDGKELLCEVTATNAGGAAQAETDVLPLVLPVPMAVTSLKDVSVEQGADAITVDAAPAFEGIGLTFAIAGADATIDAATGTVSIPTDSPRRATVTVTASNSGGTAESSFLVTIKAAEVEEPEGPPAPLADGQWQILRSEPSPEIAAGSFRPVVSIDPNLGVEAAQWTTSAQTPALAQHWETLAPTGESGSFTTEMLNQGTGNWHVFTDDNTSRRSNFRIRYRLAADGAWSAESAAKTVPLPEAVVLPAPGIAGTLADISAEQGTPALDVDAAAAFSGDELVFAVTGAGAEIDAGTGLLTISTDELRDAAEVVVTASNSGGSAEIRFQVDITAAAFVSVPPLMLAGPVLVGSAKVGTALTVETGSWGGDPAPGIACQWLRDGAPIEGAVGIEYLATAEDDLAEIACRVTATNTGGSAEALTAAVTVTHVAPSAKGELFEEILDEGTGPQEIPTAQDFEGEALTFAVTGADATIDAATGIVSIPTDSPVDGATVTVTASNSGGEAELSFLVTIEAVEVPEVAPVYLGGNPGFNFSAGTSIAPFDFGKNWSGNNLVFSVSPTLPLGLTLSAVGVLSGTPAHVAADTVFTITARNSSGQASDGVRIRVSAAAPIADPNVFANPTHPNGAWRMPLSAMKTKTYANAPEVQGLDFTYGFWVDTTAPVYEATENDPIVRVYYNFATWGNLYNDTWRRTGNSGAAERAIMASASSTFPQPWHQYVSVTASKDGTRRTLPASYDPRTDPSSPPLKIRAPAGMTTGHKTDSTLSIWQPDGTVFEAYSAIIMNNGDIVCWTYKITNPSLGGDGWQNGTRASMIPHYAGVFRDHEWQACETIGAMSEGPAKEAALEAAIPHAVGFYAPPSILKNSAVHPAVTVDKGALQESPAYSGNNPMGARFALPASTDIKSIALYTPQGRAMAYAAKNYGLIAVDRSGPGMVVLVEPESEVTYDWSYQSDLHMIRSSLQKVTGISGPFVSG